MEATAGEEGDSEEEEAVDSAEGEMGEEETEAGEAGWEEAEEEETAEGEGTGEVEAKKERTPSPAGSPMGRTRHPTPHTRTPSCRLLARSPCIPTTW